MIIRKKNLKIGILDIEAFDWSHFYIAGLLNETERNIYYFRNLSSLLSHIDKKKYDLIFCYNLSYDGSFIIEYLLKNSIIFNDIIMTNGKLLSFRYNKTIFKDLYQFYFSSLREASIKYLNENDRKGEIDYKNIRELPIEEVKKYLKQDLVLEYKLYKRIDKKITKRYYSIRSYIFKEVQKNSKISLVEIYRLREQFFGGRSEIFHSEVKDKRSFVYDVNSLYPFAMTQPLPLQYIGNCSFEKFLELRENNNLDFLILFREVYDEGGYYPIYDKIGRILYSRGKRKNIYLFYSLIKKFNLPVDFSDRNIDYIHLFKKDFLNVELIKKLYNERKVNPYNKILLNSCYGKFAQFPIFEKWIITKNYKDIKNDDIVYKINDVYIISRKDAEKNVDDVNVIIAKYITDFSRFYVFETINKIQNQGFSVYYTDTDSIHTDCPPEKFEKITGIKIDGNIGNFKIEKEFSGAFYYAPKDYELINEEKIIDKKKKGFKVDIDKNVENEFIFMSVKNLFKTGVFQVSKILKKDLNQKYYKIKKGNEYYYPEIDFDYFEQKKKIFKIRY